MISFSRFKILFLANLIYLSAFGQQYDFVKIIPGKGIVYNNDSILLYKTTVKGVCRILNMKDNPKPGYFSETLWDGYDPKTGELKSGTEFTKEINFKSIIFQFADETDKNNLKLRWISIKDDKSLKIYVDNGLLMGMINPDLRNLFPETNNNDYIAENLLTYNLYTYGVSFQLIKLPNGDLQLFEISTHYKLK
jgi:hypothetical protein